MKFIRLISKHTHPELKKVIVKCSESDMEQIEKIYFELDYVEFTSKDGYVGMFAVVSDNYLSELINFYIEKSINFSYVDLSKDVLFGNKIDIEGYTVLLPEEKEDFVDILKNIIDRFYENNTNIDIILDKINEKGISSLNAFDKRILE